MRLICYPLGTEHPNIAPGRQERDWMDATNAQYAYRCLPLIIANTHGWEIRCTEDLIAAWNGGPGLNDVIVRGAGPNHGANSHFGHGVLTFHVPCLFRTEPGVNLWVTGPVNQPKDGIAALSGVLETDWMPFTFTMNWRFTRPGKVHFRKDEPFCFFFPITRGLVDRTEPEILDMSSDPETAEQFRAWSTSRTHFNAGVAAGDRDFIHESWQKTYFRGQLTTGDRGSDEHQTRIRPKPFKDRR